MFTLVALSLLAFELSASGWTAIGVVILAVGTFGGVFLQRKGYVGPAKAEHAIMQGVRAYVQDKGLGKSDREGLEDMIRASAADWGVADQVDAHIGDGLHLPSGK